MCHLEQFCMLNMMELWIYTLDFTKFLKILTFHMKFCKQKRRQLCYLVT